jgi:hypothetical protein
MDTLATSQCPDFALFACLYCDGQVSVRKAALVALCTLLELFPTEPSLARAWVSSGLPLVRDVEATVQVRTTLMWCVSNSIWC